MRRYDKTFYYQIMDDLKRVCYIRTGNNIEARRHIYGDVFCNEFNELAKKALEKLQHASTGDPRLNDKKRKDPDWAE